MSVILFSPDEIAQIAKTAILKNQRYGAAGNYWRFYDQCERLDAEDYIKQTEKGDIREMEEQDLACWIERLSLSNQLAYFYNYSAEKIEITRLDEKDIQKAMPLGNMKLYVQLRSLRYNLYSNCGNSFVSEKDLDKLNSLIEYLKDSIIENYQRKEGEGA